MDEKVVVKRPPKSPGVAGVLAFFFPFGTGALYNGQIRKAIIFFFTFALLCTMLSADVSGELFFGLMMVGFYFYQIFDAVQTAKSINRRALDLEEEEVTDLEEIPEMVKSGSIFWGAILMLLGVILLFANFEVISYDTIGEFWPVAIIIIGIKFISDFYKKEKESS